MTSASPSTVSIHPNAAQGSNAAQGPQLLPLIVGITGHRDLRDEDLPQLAEATREVLSTLRARYPSTPLIVLSPLGEGADRLVARVGLEEGARLIVPLPFPRELYLDTFSDDASRREFAALESRAMGGFTTPWISETASETADEMPTGEALESQFPTQYAAMGTYIARHSHVLLALWDGDDNCDNERTGGTAQIVRFRLQGAPPPFAPEVSPLEKMGYGTVHHIVTPRRSCGIPIAAHFSHRLLDPEHLGEDHSRLDAFNFDILAHPELAASAAESALALMGEDRVATEASHPKIPPPVAPIPPNLRPMLAIYGWSDVISTHFARQMSRVVRRIFLLVFLAAFCFNLFHSLPHGEHDPAAVSLPSGAHSPASELATSAAAPGASHGAAAGIWGALPWFLLLYLAFVVLNVVIHRRAEKRELQNKYQDYRALAEGLRVQLFWRLVGLRDEVSDYYLGKQRGELSWIHDAIKSCNVLTDAAEEIEPARAETFVPLVLEQWVAEQLNYYVRKTGREKEGLERSERLIQIALLGSINLAVFLALLLSLPILPVFAVLEPLKAWVEQPLPHALTMITIVMLAVTAGLVHGYNQHLARAEHTKRFGRMAVLFTGAMRQLKTQDASDEQQTHLLLRDLGKEALVENGEWVLLHRERPIEVPHAG